jgi:hypothetical protein
MTEHGPRRQPRQDLPPALLPTRQLVTEATLASMVVDGLYQALLSGLRSEGLVRRGL